MLERLRSLVPAYILWSLSIFTVMGLYRQVWRYASAREIIQIEIASMLAALGLWVISIFLPGGFSRAVLLLTWILTTFFVGGIRYFIRLLNERPGTRLQTASRSKSCQA